MDPDSPETDNVADLEQHCILFPTYATRYSRSGSKDPLDWNIRVRGWAFTKRSNRRKRLVMSMARKLAGVTKDNKVYETLESRFGMFLASNTQGARFTIQCIGPAKTNQMELASEHNLPDQSVEALISDIKAPDAALAAAEAAEDKAQLRKSLQEDRGDLIREVKHEQHDHEYPSKAVGHAVDKFMRARQSDVGDNPKLIPENDASLQKPPPSNERHEASFSDRWAKGAAIMKGAYQKYKPMVIAHVNNSVDALNGCTRQESETPSYAGNASSTSSPSCSTKSESGDSVMPQTDTYYEDLGYGDLPTVDISSVPGGHFDGTLRVSNEDIQAQKATDSLTGGQRKGGHPRFLKLHAYHPNMVDESVGTVNLIDPEGVSIISDIDDTIKETNILAGATIVLRNTFLKEMRDVPGMADVYMQWWKHGAALHYVSNSPWQLIPSLLDFFRNHKFPPGSAHLRLTDSMLKTYFMTPGEHKRKSIREILTDFPQRKFILIGDSGEIDMEIYTQIAVDFPDQIFKIFIRDITTARLQEMAAKNNMAPSRSRSFTSSSTKTSIFAAATGFFSRHSDSSRTQTPNVTEVKPPSSTATCSTESGEERQEDTASFASMTIGLEQEDSSVKSPLSRQRSSTYSSSGSMPQDTPSKAPPLPPRDSSPAAFTSTTTTTTTTSSSSTSSSSSSTTVSTATTRVTSTTDVAALDDEPMPGAPPPSDSVTVKSPLEVWMDRVEQCQKRLPEGMLTFFEDSSTLLEDPIVSGMILHHKESISDEEEE
ncbi:hypothetical protein BGZ80_003313 [Entomortierella chlamydospora]|uniref:Phosphatidate phosphatase APP1 catalytic domain-containing protein n=1 Tax=Entomortierella chlamydospora TaxID=101097 RepID=A0A9P6N0R3_9FUNG|nr:hypothetical protein BGZ79_006567 [Entomortierella chlamydospora]KAG0020948.1 hypothetical protein BGZ80_003313 [Entomortierella chlamydospora]